MMKQKHPNNHPWPPRLCLLLAMLLTCCFGGRLMAQTTFTVGDFFYRVLPDGGSNVSIEATSFDLSGEITIPNTVKYNSKSYTVTEIAEGGFFQTKITKVTIGGAFSGSITKIGDDAFCYCEQLQDVYINGQIESIGTRAFLGCTELTNLSLFGSRLQFIGSQAFENCAKLNAPGKFFIINPNITTIGDYAFANTGFERVTLPPKLKRIPKGAFYDCANLEYVAWPDSLKSIASYAMYGCSKLRNAVLKNGVDSIGEFAFRGCQALSMVKLPPSLKFIGSDCFQSCGAVTDITIPDLIETIPTDAFAYCRSLSSVKLPSRLKTIGLSAFSDCSALSTIVIPNSVESIAKYAFYSTGLTDVFISPSVKSIDSNAFHYSTKLKTVCLSYTDTPIGTDFNSILSCFKNATKFYVPRGMASHYAGANTSGAIIETDFGFQLNKAKTNPVIGETLSLPSVATTFPSYLPAAEGVTWTVNNTDIATVDADGNFVASKLGNVSLTATGTFAGNTFATNLNLNIGIKSDNINYAILSAEDKTVAVVSVADGANVTTVSIPAQLSCGGETYQVKAVAPKAFTSCSKLTSISIPEGITSIGDSVFRECIALTSITLPQSATTLGRDLFAGCTSLTNVTLPNTLTVIPANTFKGCSSLTTVELPASVSELGNAAFYGCSALTAIALPANTKTVGESLFENCTSLRTVTLPESLTAISRRMFEGCTKLQSIKLPNGITSIGARAFYNCRLLSNLVLPLSLTKIEAQTFVNCVSLSDIAIPNNVKEIGYLAFWDTNLDRIFISPSVEYIDPQAFYNCTNLHGYVAYTQKPARMTFAEVRALFKALVVPEGMISSYPNFSGWDANFGAELYLGERICIGETATLEWSVVPNFVPQSAPIQFTSENPEIATVDSNGNVTATGCGRATITATVNLAGNIYTHSDEIMTGIKIDGVKYMINPDVEGEVAVVGADADLTDIIIPELVSINGKTYSVGLIAGESFVEHQMKSVTIPNSVKTIYGAAFAGCKQLETVVLSENLTEIKSGTFESCRKLKSITLPEKITYIGSYAFEDCESLSEINIPAGVTEIGSNAFMRCRSLKSIEIARGVTRISQNTFAGCSNIESLNIPTSVKQIDNSAFAGWTSLKRVFIPKSVETLFSPFTDCTALQAIYLPYISNPGTNYRFSDLVNNLPANCTLYVPRGMKSTYTQYVSSSRVVETDFGIAVDAVPNMIGDATHQLSYRALPDIMTFDGPATWSSSNTGVATVDANGVVTAVGPGTATITARIYSSGTAYAATTPVTVRAAALNVTQPSGRVFSTINVPVELKNSVEVISFQCDIHLPEGFEPVLNTAGKPVAKLTARKSRSHNITTSVQPGNVVRVTSFSTSNASYSGRDGALFTLDVKATTAKAGMHPVTIDNIVVVDVNRQGVVMDNGGGNINIRIVAGDANIDEIVNVSDASAAVSYIHGNRETLFDFESADVNPDNFIDMIDVSDIIDIALGGDTEPVVPAQAAARSAEASARTAAETGNFYLQPLTVDHDVEALLTVKFDNIDRYTNFQTDIYLPAELEVLTYNEGGKDLPDVELNYDIDSGSHTISSRIQKDGALRVLCMSVDNSPFLADNSGVVFTVRVKPTYNMAEGRHAVQFRRTTCDTDGFHMQSLPDATSYLQLDPNLTGIEDVEADSYDGEAVYYNLQGLRIEKPQPRTIYIKVKGNTATKVLMQ